MNELKSVINDLKIVLKHIHFDNLKDSNFKNYKEIKTNYNLSLLKSSLQKIKSISLTLDNTKISSLFYELENSFKQKNKNKMIDALEKLDTLNKDLPVIIEEISFKIPSLPSDIKDDISLDIKELELCFNSNCFRSSIILCGRILETALHRKYYEITSIDLLEKAPGIGLGKIIAKLKEKNIEIEPGLTQQIHLINQVRIFSVHKKTSMFTPSKKQTHAIILYTLDVLNKLFKHNK